MAVAVSEKRKVVDADASSFLGPVGDLEKFVQPDWWRHIFNSNSYLI